MSEKKSYVYMQQHVRDLTNQGIKLKDILSISKDELSDEEVARLFLEEKNRPSGFYSEVRYHFFRYEGDDFEVERPHTTKSYDLFLKGLDTVTPLIEEQDYFAGVEAIENKYYAVIERPHKVEYVLVEE